MQTSTVISNREDTIDSRDIRPRIKALEDELYAEYDAEFEDQNLAWCNWLDDPHTDYADQPFKPKDVEDWISEVSDASDLQDKSLEEAATELLALRELDQQAKDCSDWGGGSTLVRDEYFQSYARELAEDIGATPRGHSWPACHIDWEAAAESLLQDYMGVDFDGVLYYVRS